LLETIRIENYKSIEKLTVPLGRIIVFIGENGAGKTNILEAIALAGAARADKLDNEFLASRGIRVSGPELMRSAFKKGKANEPIKVSFKVTSGAKFDLELTNDNEPYSAWQSSGAVAGGLTDIEEFIRIISDYGPIIKDEAERKQFFEELIEKIRSSFKDAKTEDLPSGRKRTTIEINFRAPDIPPGMDTGGIEDFIVYAPENSALRLFEREGQIEPLGINGEGLLKLLTVISTNKNRAAINSIKASLRLIGWFKDFKIPEGRSRDTIEIIDQFLSRTKSILDQRSANEGFLFLAFYFALFTSNLTPRFFSVDNVDASLNPKLCEALTRRLAQLAKEYDKQVLFTTHNPAILDGLDLGDPEQRLFIVSRGPRGETRARRFEKKPSTERPRRLSELFLSGVLGGLPKGF
jgi:predicted ATPase